MIPLFSMVVRFHLAGSYDYSSNTLHPTLLMGSMSSAGVALADAGRG